jgi:P22 coat protein - gene protein 5
VKGFDNSYQKDYERPFPVGETIYPRLPWRFTKADGLGYQPQPLVDRVTSITMNQVFQYSFEWNSTEKALTLPREQLKQLYTDPAVNQMAQDIESAAALFAINNTPNVVGSLGSAITDLVTLRNSQQKLVELAGWMEGEMSGALTPGMANQIVGLGQTFFNPESQLAEQYQTMKIGRYAGTMWNQSVSLYSHTAGTITAPTVTGANQAGSSIIITGANLDTLSDGDKISFGTNATQCNAVNPATRRNLGTATLQAAMFNVVGNYTLDGSADTINIFPSIIGPGSQYQNVDALPQNGATVILFPGTTSPNGKAGPLGCLFSKEAFAVVGARLEEPMSAELHSVQTIPGTPVSVRFTRSWDPFQSRMINRFDLLFGFGRKQPENCAVLIAGNV